MQGGCKTTNAGWLWQCVLDSSHFNKECSSGTQECWEFWATPLWGQNKSGKNSAAQKIKNQTKPKDTLTLAEDMKYLKFYPRDTSTFTISKHILESRTVKSIISDVPSKLLHSDTNGKSVSDTSSCNPATPSSEAVNPARLASGTFAPRCCTKSSLQSLGTEADYFPTQAGDYGRFPISSESCFLRLLWSMSSFSSGTQSQIVLHSRNGYYLQFSALGTKVIAEQGDPLLTIQQQFCLPCFCNRIKSRAAIYFEYICS